MIPFHTQIRLPRRMVSVQLCSPVPYGQSAIHASATSGMASAGHPQGGAPSLSKNDVETLLASINEAFCELEARRQASLSDLRQLAVELAIAATAKIFDQEVSADRFPLESIIETLIDSCDGDPVSVRLNPVDYATINRSLAESNSLDESMQLVADSSIGRGGCRVQSKRYDLIREPQLQLEQVRQSVMEIMDDASTERRKTDSANSRLQRFPDRRSAS